MHSKRKQQKTSHPAKLVSKSKAENVDELVTFYALPNPSQQGRGLTTGQTLDYITLCVLLDAENADADGEADFSRLVAKYRRWAGIYRRRGEPIIVTHCEAAARWFLRGSVTPLPPPEVTKAKPALTHKQKWDRFLIGADWIRFYQWNN